MRYFKKGQVKEPTRFVTINFKLNDYFSQDNITSQIQQIENFYTEIDNCDDAHNNKWNRDSIFNDLYLNQQDRISVCIVPKHKLLQSITDKDNWAKYFISANLFESFDSSLEHLYPKSYKCFSWRTYRLE